MTIFAENLNSDMDWYILLAALLPVVILLCLIWKRDKLQREPIWLVILAFVVGSLSVPLSMVLSIPAMIFWTQNVEPWMWSVVTNVYDAFFEAAIPEELAKFAILWLFLLRNKWFDEYMDGIVYACAISLGFAGLENIMYLFGEESWGLVAIGRAVLSVPLHFACGIVMGYYFSLWRIDKVSKYFKYAIAAPIIVHGLYDFALMYFSTSEYVTTAMVAAFFFGLHYLRKLCTELINRHLNNDSNRMSSFAVME